MERLIDPVIADLQCEHAEAVHHGHRWRAHPTNGRDMMMNMFIHVAHHRAQCEVYLRLEGVTPPIYTF